MVQHISLKHIFDEEARIPKGVEYGLGGNAPMSLHSCVKIFNDFAARDGFDYYRDGCYARAHLMCRALEQMDIKPAKAWAFKNVEYDRGVKFEQNLWVDINDDVQINWRYHVAACVPVRMPDKSIQNIVLDPTIMNGPATVEQWRDVIHALDRNVEVVPFRKRTTIHNADYSPNEETAGWTDVDAKDTVKMLSSRNIEHAFIKKQSDLMQSYVPPRRQCGVG